MSSLSRRLRMLALPAILFAIGACGSTDQIVSPVNLHPVSTAYVGGAATVVISQVFGGGGNGAGTVSSPFAPFRNDFIELYNATSSPVNLTGWSVQYASSAGTTWAVTNLSGTLQPGQYYLVQQAAGVNTMAASLPTPNATGTIAMSATAGKVALVNSTTALAGSGCPLLSTSSIVDFVGFGGANCSEGTATPVLSNTTAAVRKNGGKTDDNDNSLDFTVSPTITPRNTASPINPVTPQLPVASITVTPANGAVKVGFTLPFNAVAKDASNNATSSTFAWSSSNTAVATINPTTGVATGVSVGTTTIIAKSLNNVEGSTTLNVTVDGTVPPPLPAVRFSEVHYDNDGIDVGEGIEIEAPAGTNLAGYKVGLYSLSDGVVTNYDTRTLSGLVPSLCSGRGVIVLEYPSNGIQNGGNDGMALIDASGAVIEFLSYEGVLTTTIGTSTLTSTDIGVSQTSAALGTSLQRSATGTWTSGSSNFYGCNGRTTGRALTGFAFGGRAPSDAALPVGFESQIFVTARQGTVVVPHVWSSDTPAIATIDADGVIRSIAPGDAIFRATTTDGLSTATYTLPMVLGVASTTALYIGNAAFGEPTDGNPADDFIIRRMEYTSSFNTTRNTPNWVAYNLEQSHLVSGADRCNCFTYDPELPQAKRYTTNEFTGVGDIYNRGHLVRSADRTTGTLDNARTYYFSNIIPQAADNNQGPWSVLETYLGNLARNSDREIYIITGVAGNIGTLKNEGDVVIPGSVWKVAVIMPRNQGLANLTTLSSAEVIAVIMPNVNGIRNVPWETYKTTVDAIELLSGYDLLALLRDDLETAIESNTKFPDAATNGPFTEVVGTVIPISAAASTDPDGDALTFRWSFGDGAMATGVNTTHTYSTAGTFTVRLIATDVRGLADTVFTTANVQSAAQAIERAITATSLLEANGVLGKGPANSIAAKLRNAQKQAERGGHQAASNILGALLNELDAMVKTNRVMASNVAILRSLVERSIVALRL